MCSGVIYMLDIQKNHSEECTARSEWRFGRLCSSPAGVSVVPEQEGEGDVEAGGPVVLYVRGAGEVAAVRELFRLPPGRSIYAAFLAGYPVQRFYRIPFREVPSLVWI